MTHQKPAGLAPALGVVRPANSQAPLPHVTALGKPSLEDLADEWVNRHQDIRVRHLITHQKPAGHVPALGVLRPAFRIDTAGQVTLEPCTKCHQNAVCMPVAGRYGRRSYPYCVERCWPMARAASETLVKAAPAARPSMLCSCCGEFSHVRPVILSGNRMTSLFFCETTCWSARLATIDMVPTCTQCGRYLQPNEYTDGKCGVCK